MTQSRTLNTAEQMVRDYIETLTDKDVSRDTVVIAPDLGELDHKVTTVLELLAAADRQQQEARNSYRALAADLRAAGLSVRTPPRSSACPADACPSSAKAS